MSEKKVKPQHIIKIQVQSFSQIFYLDTNVIRDLSECRITNANQKTNLIKNLIQSGKLALAPSFEVLGELLLSPDISREKQIKNVQFYDEISAWEYALKPSGEVVREDANCFLYGKGPSCPYRGIDEEQSGFVQLIRDGKDIFSDKEKMTVIQNSQTQNIIFVKKLFTDFVSRLV